MSALVVVYGTRVWCLSSGYGMVWYVRVLMSAGLVQQQTQPVAEVLVLVWMTTDHGGGWRRTRQRSALETRVRGTHVACRRVGWFPLMLMSTAAVKCCLWVAGGSLHLCLLPPGQHTYISEKRSSIPPYRRHPSSLLILCTLRTEPPKYEGEMDTDVA